MISSEYRVLWPDMQTTATTFDWNAFTSALIGGVLALLGVFAAARLERQARQGEERARFQRDTLIELQDTLESFLRDTYSLHLWREAPKRWEEDSAQMARAVPDPPPGMTRGLPPFDHAAHAKQLNDERHLATWTDSRFRLQRLTSRVDNKEVRDQIETLVETTRPVLTQEVWQEADAIGKRLNAEIGRLIRDGSVTEDGFTAPKLTGRPLL